ncbi:ATP-dependent protease [Pseudoalteromonas porphyrae]|uniref:ATP-dependent protease n=1 Tax=Pseudoalteromonas porphyrae TaxID=187330 RepID=A0A0N0LZ46_9GAMM|nr:MULTISPECIES: LON peptidase substrate-binding domain-containing protein [Pseudoalteromonas]KPH62471.1 ATP-dependent protease [Pseudoalteromonas porphyrae]KPH95896.1 ATP-dependent protease [Pseudoalteromonas porphyrae]NMR25603.1 ATP-dependent protease [Pseudoalteromonas sp. NEC-BIFX-2020_015]
MKRAIFPLPVFLLPHGYTRLRIFEQRYLDMVKESLKSGSGFVLCQYDIDCYLNTPTRGCLVEIVDFTLDEGGVLVIDVAAMYAVEITDVVQDKNKLRYGQTSKTKEPNWFTEPHTIERSDTCLVSALKDLFADNKQLRNLYRETQFDNFNWVIARWLELLPISIDKKQQLAYKSDFANIHTFLHTVINNEFT